MDLALIVERFNTRGGGLERSAAQIAGQLAARGHQVEVLTRHAILHGELDTIKVTVFRCSNSNRTIGLLRFALWARHILRSGQFDASLSFTMTAPATVLQPRGGTVRETHRRNVAVRRSGFSRMAKIGLLALSPRQHILLALERRTIRDELVQRFAAVSEYVADQLQRHYGVSPDRIDLIPNAAEMPTVSPVQRQQWRQRIREAFDVPRHAVAYLFAAHNSRLKGIETLLHASRHLARQGLDFVLFLAGVHRYQDQRMAARLGIRDRIRFVGTTNQMAQLYCAADVTCLPTYYDPSSKVIIESLMMGTPAISTAYNGSSSWIVPKSGQARGRVIADPADDVALAGAMVELADADQHRKCAEAAAGLAEQLSMKQHVDRLEMVLQKVAFASGR